MSVLPCFYSDLFVLPLPERHRFPMAKYRLLRERLVADGVVSESDLHVPGPSRSRSCGLHTRRHMSKPLSAARYCPTNSDGSDFRGPK
jgi:hypothetical protein